MDENVSKIPEREKARNLLLANITHEFRTPIQTILSTIDLLSETPLNSEQSEYIQQVHFAADSLLSLVNDFLDFSKLESGQFRYEYIPFDPLLLVEQTVELLAIEAFNKGIEIITDIDYALPQKIVSDPTRIRQIILNLLKNAVKFTPSGYVQVSIFCDEKLKELTVQVKDSGIGISKENQKLLFTDFYQTDASTTRKYGGTGLGLAISKNFVTQMGGSIKMEDNPDGGSIFSFTLPYKDSTDEVIEQNLQLDKSITKNQKLLIVDDQKSAVDSMVKKLSLLGFENVSAVMSGEEALALMRAEATKNVPFTQIYIDMVMPQMDGWRLSYEINKDTTINDAKLYLLIPEGQMGGDAKMKRLKWFNNYLYKPIKKVSLVELLTEASEDDLELEVVDDDTAITERKVVSKEKTAGTLIIDSETTEKKPAYDLIAKGKTILIAEDHPVNQKLIKTFFEQFGAEVICASDGQEAIDNALVAEKLDIIFTDIQMPLKSGVEVAQELRSLEIEIPIIACTANTDQEDFEEYYKVGINDVLIKPFRKQLVYDFLKNWLKKIDEQNLSAQGNQQKSNLNDANDFSGSKIWDLEEFSIITGGNDDLGKDLIVAFTEQTVILFEKIEVGIKDIDFASIKSAAHTIKGSAATLAIPKLSDIAKKLEFEAKAENLENCEKYLKECSICFYEFKKYGEDWLSQHDISI